MLRKIDGPWLTEPTEVLFEYAGLQCAMLRRDAHSHWRGYVGLPKDHPLYGVGYREESPALALALEARKEMPLGEKAGLGLILSVLLGGELTANPETVFVVHGGLTFAEDRIATENAPEGLWWFGFDCAHAGDLSLEYGNVTGEEVWCDVNYARAETELLADQLATVARPALAERSEG